MKRDVVNQKLLRIFQGGEHLSDLFRHRRQLFSGRAFGRQTCGANFQNRSRLKHVLEAETMELGEQAQGFTVERRRPIYQERAGALPRMKDAHRDQRAQPGA